MIIGLIQLALIKGKICGAKIISKLADILRKCGLSLTRAVWFVSDWDMAIISHSKCCSMAVISHSKCCNRVKKRQNCREDMFPSSRLHYLC
jgi:hypothetical protein